MEVLRRGTSRMDAARGVKGQDGPCTPAPGAAPEGGKSGGAAARPGCRGALSFAYFSLRKQRKVRRRKGARRDGIYAGSPVSLRWWTSRALFTLRTSRLLATRIQAIC